MAKQEPSLWSWVMWQLVRKKSSHQHEPYLCAGVGWASTPSPSPFLASAPRDFLHLADRKWRLKEVKSLAQGHLSVNDRARSYLGLSTARFQQVVTLCASCFPIPHWLFSVTQFMLPAGKSMGLGDRIACCTLPLPGKDGCHLPQTLGRAQ